MEGVRGNTPALIFDIAEGGIDDIVAALVEKGVTIVTPVSEAPGAGAPTFWIRMALASASTNPATSRAR